MSTPIQKYLFRQLKHLFAHYCYFCECDIVKKKKKKKKKRKHYDSIYLAKNKCQSHICKNTELFIESQLLNAN